MITTLIVHDEALLRAGLRLLVDAADGLTGCQAGGEEALVEARRRRPEVVLLDLGLRTADGLSVLDGLLELPEPPRVAVLSGPSSRESVLAALSRGAAGCLFQDTGPEELVTSVRALAAGSTVLSRLASARLLTELGKDVQDTADTVRARRLTQVLNARERDVLMMLAEGLPNADIGRRLGLGTATVKDCVSDILTKLNVTNRVQAAVIADRAKLVVGRRPSQECAA
ncbi:MULTISPECIES: response regulator transcription factor [unclassified Streptomyces]|uniref:LuxR C-terminal-related transcriptional regulator n=1 Tax=unclassified Streptomyces TaxID=2593676 RepID=UPI000A89D97D|nr:MULTISPECIES: response regulator transcription factor [unclassified Streptomyces]